jgi:hypothetical protein
LFHEREKKAAKIVEDEFERGKSIVYVQQEE